MATVAELTVAEEIVALKEVADGRGWPLNERDDLHFLLSLPASDETSFHLLVDCENYPVVPPAWHWCNQEGEQLDSRAHTPEGSGFLHSAGVVCAPWNRLAYKSVDQRGPHQDWAIGDWRNNSHTGGCKTLSSMALRIYVELNGPRYNKRRLAQP
jgi:hypothetical protein